MPEIIKSHILHLLEKDRTPRKLVHLEQELGVQGDLKTVFRQAIESLCAQGRIIVGPGNVVRLPAESNEVTGVFKANPRGYGFITPEQSDVEGELFIPANATGNAMTGDRVVAKILRRGDEDRLSGQIVRILDRAHKTVVGTLHQAPTGWLVQPAGGAFSRPLQSEGIEPKEGQPDWERGERVSFEREKPPSSVFPSRTPGVRRVFRPVHPPAESSQEISSRNTGPVSLFPIRHGDKVCVQIRSYPTRSQAARGVITQVLGRPGGSETEIAAVIQRHGLRDAFDPSSLVEAVNARSAFNPHDTRDREDLAGTLIVTIDPPDAKDFDDAVSLTRDREGQWVLGVHIADVSHFVAEGSALDRAARERGNSVYLPGKTLPMLPEMLSNDLCSLQPGQRRYTKSVFLTYSKDAHIRSVRFANTIIKSKARLTYLQADQVLQGDPAGLPKDVVALLHDMESLARGIEDRRRRAGMLQLDAFANELVKDEVGQVIGVQPEDTSYPHTIIEMFMVEANVAVATLLDRYCIPFMRRIHPEPDSRALYRLSQTLRLLGVTLSRKPQRADIQAVLSQIRGTKVALPVNLLVLRTLERATYSPASVGHYALAASKYCHFTSPIRRYADLIVHRALQGHLTGGVDRIRRLYAFPDLAELGEHISETERVADEAEQELKTILILHLLQRRVGEELEGVVVSLSGHGAAVHLPEYGVEGLIPREALGPDRWQFDEQNQCLLGRHTGAILRLGQTMQVRSVDVRPAGGQLDLAPAGGLVMKPPEHGKRPAPRRGSSAKRRRSRKKRTT
jgi:ribonuclease R